MCGPAVSAALNGELCTLQELMMEGQGQYKLESVSEDSQIEEHRREAHRLAGRTGVGPEV